MKVTTIIAKWYKKKKKKRKVVAKWVTIKRARHVLVIKHNHVCVL